MYRTLACIVVVVITHAACRSDSHLNGCFTAFSSVVQEKCLVHVTETEIVNAEWVYVLHLIVDMTFQSGGDSQGFEIFHFIQIIPCTSHRDTLLLAVLRFYKFLFRLF